MRIALISDLHGNALALEAVLADAASRGFDRLVCLGDVATLGPRPAEVLARLQDLRCDCLLGNHDEFMLKPKLVEEYTSIPVIVASVNATRERLTSSELSFIAGFQRTLELGDVFLFHGTPRSNTEDLLVSTPTESVDEMLDGHRALVLAGGHTHVQMLRQHRGMLIVNVGSLGQPFREFANHGPPVILPHAEYAIVEVKQGGASVDLRRVPLDRQRLASQVSGWDNPLAPALRASYA